MKIGVVGVFKCLFKCKSGVLPSLCCLQGWWIALFPLLLNQPLLQSLLLSPNCVSQPSSGPESGTAWNRQFLRITSQYLIWKCRAYSRERWYMYTYVCACICASYFSHVRLFVIPWTVAWQTPLSVVFFKQEYRSGLPCPPPGDLPNSGVKSAFLVSPALADGFFTTSATRETHMDAN